MDSLDFRKEDIKYSTLWKTKYKEARYFKLIIQLVKIYQNKDVSIVDLGCGNGKAMKDLIRLGYRNISGVDISIYIIKKLKKENLNVYPGSLDNLKIFRNNQFEIGFCNDVLEHIDEKYLSQTLDEMSRICLKTIFLSICPRKSHHKSLEGENLHLTVRNIIWWELFLKRYGKLNRIEPIWQKPFNSSLRYRLDLN